jgi:4,5-dihydroxyphthalate decarboxylase
VKAAASAFKRVVRDLEFDFAELAIVTFLIAKAHGKPLVLLPAVVRGRFQHPYLVYNPARGPLGPGDLAGRRVGVRSSRSPPARGSAASSPTTTAWTSTA